LWGYRNFSTFQDGSHHHLKFLKFLIFGWSDLDRWESPPCQISSKLVNTLWRYSDVSVFQNGYRQHLGFLNFLNFIGWPCPESGEAQTCQISSKLVEQFLRYHDYFIIQDGCRRHLGFQKFWNFIGWRVQRTQMHHRAKFRPNPQFVVELLRFFDFSRWRPSAILDLFRKYSDHQRRVFGGLYHCAKFGYNRCSRF